MECMKQRVLFNVEASFAMIFFRKLMGAALAMGRVVFDCFHMYEM